MTLRIDSLKPGTKVTLDLGVSLGYEDPEASIFVKMEGTGDDRRATFETPLSGDTPAYEWDAYRFQGRWCYGSSADRLRLVSVD